MGGLDRLTLALNPQDEDERQALKQLAVLDEKTLAAVSRMLDRESRRPILMVAPDEPIDPDAAEEVEAVYG